MKSLIILAALGASTATSAFAQPATSPSLSGDSALSSPTASSIGKSGAKSPSMPGAVYGPSTRLSPDNPLSPASRPSLGDASTLPLGGEPANPLGRTPSSIPPGVGAGLNQNSTASGRASPGSPITDAGTPSGAPLGTDVAAPR